jgi:lipoyl(octanoyl) transferase
VIIQTLVKFGISAGREKEMTGVWVQGEKIAAIGVKVSRWVTMHGFALNVNTDLEKFNRIIPCGIFHKGVTSMQKILGQVLPFQSVQEALVYSFANVFGNQPRWIDKEALNAMIQNLNTEEKEKELSQNLATQ